ncbi:heavy metal-associated isoprenylated plant protein 7-like [Andrographis paniculata]|uniref:heavy metal-associated isoprenylated plant protein 7-like n=1 Tax=Andrographis paniculata TaxID=175694 RepID=UPI0021E70C75|nr:heavy metal-associated isoprenylated plant protein 7-like [Andrographis paniculata]
MGEEEKRPEEEEQEKKKTEQSDVKAEDGKKEAEAKLEECKETKEPPPEIVLKVYMHCEGCARKVRRHLKGFQGVEDVITDCKESKVVVKGEKADPLKVLERIQRKSHRQVELISPIPKPPTEDPPPAEEKPIAKVEDKKVELPVITVVLRIYMHCEACALGIKKRIQRMKGVENAEPELKSSEVTVKGAFEAEKLADYVYRRTGKHATIVKVEPEKKEEEEEEKGKEEKKAVAEGEGAGEGEQKSEAGNKSEDSGGDKENKESGGGDPPPAEMKLEIKRNDYYYPAYFYPQNHLQMNNYPPQGFVQEHYYYAADPRIVSPQIFSDENPNACSVM